MNIISITITVIIIIIITASCSFFAQRQTSHYLLIDKTTRPRYTGKQIFARLISERTQGLPYKWNITGCSWTLALLLSRNISSNVFYSKQQFCQLSSCSTLNTSAAVAMSLHSRWKTFLEQMSARDNSEITFLSTVTQARREQCYMDCIVANLWCCFLAQ